MGECGDSKRRDVEINIYSHLRPVTPELKGQKSNGAFRVDGHSLWGRVEAKRRPQKDACCDATHPVARRGFNLFLSGNTAPEEASKMERSSQ